VVGLVPRTGGEVLLDGRPLAGREARSRVAYVPQRNDVDWDFPISVEDVVLLGRQGRLGLWGRPGRADRQAAREALERLGMDGLRRAQIGELSGGQQQRVFLARALAQDGDVLLLDEPLTGVDTATQEVVVDLLHTLRAAGQAILVCTHDLPQAARVCDQLCLLNRVVTAFGPPSEILDAETLVRTYGGSGLVGHLPVPHGGGDACEPDPPPVGAGARRLRPH
jgi:ABC-type Mn2+/Zn2+ transport system ATPase subunit